MDYLDFTNHGDVGGYISTNAPKIHFNVPFVGFARQAKMLKRWIEMRFYSDVSPLENQPTRHIEFDSNEDV